MVTHINLKVGVNAAAVLVSETFRRDRRFATKAPATFGQCYLPIERPYSIDCEPFPTEILAMLLRGRAEAIGVIGISVMSGQRRAAQQRSKFSAVRLCL